MQFAKIMLLNRTCVNGLILWEKTPLGFNREPERHYSKWTNTCGGLNQTTKQKLCYANAALFSVPENCIVLNSYILVMFWSIYKFGYVCILYVSGSLALSLQFWRVCVCVNVHVKIRSS